MYVVISFCLNQCNRNGEYQSHTSVFWEWHLPLGLGGEWSSSSELGNLLMISWTLLHFLSLALYVGLVSGSSESVEGLYLVLFNPGFGVWTRCGSPVAGCNTGGLSCASITFMPFQVWVTHNCVNLPRGTTPVAPCYCSRVLSALYMSFSAVLMAWWRCHCACY